MLEKKIVGEYILKEFNNKMYDGRVFKLTGTALVFQIHPQYGIRFWTTGHGVAIQEHELDMINKVVKLLKEEKIVYKLSR